MKERTHIWKWDPQRKQWGRILKDLSVKHVKDQIHYYELMNPKAVYVASDTPPKETF